MELGRSYTTKELAAELEVSEYTINNVFAKNKTLFIVGTDYVVAYGDSLNWLKTLGIIDSHCRNTARVYSQLGADKMRRFVKERPKTPKIDAMITEQIRAQVQAELTSNNLIDKILQGAKAEYEDKINSLQELVEEAHKVSDAKDNHIEDLRKNLAAFQDLAKALTVMIKKGNKEN